MEIVNWLARDEVEKILLHEPDGERILYGGISEWSVQQVLDLLTHNGIKFYRSIGEV